MRCPFVILLLLVCFEIRGEPLSVLDFSTAWQRVVFCHPSLKAAQAEICARQGDTWQASLCPNPVLTVEGDNIGVRRNKDNEAEPPETTFAISQLLELGGKRRARTIFSSKLEEVAYWEGRILANDIYYDLVEAYIAVSALQEKLTCTQERVCLAEEALAAIQAEVACGKCSPIQVKKGEMALLEAQLAYREISSELERAKSELSSLWGCPNPDFKNVNFPFFDCVLQPDPCFSSQDLNQNPYFAALQAGCSAAIQNIQLQKANSIPDVCVTVGYTLFNDSRQHGWLVGAEIPLPFFNRNQGNIKRAYAEKIQADCTLESAMSDLSAKLALTHEQMCAAFDEYLMMKERILPDAEETVWLIKTGYDNGKFCYADFLDAQQTLLEIQESYIEILAKYHLCRAEWERLLGGRK
jgi:cobalt-zinc-cadmium efflux system outer membrane protein